MFWCRRFVCGVVKNALYCVPSFSNVLFVFIEFVTVICLFCFSDVLFQNGVACAQEHDTMTKDSVKVLAREDIWLKRKVREAITIKIGQTARGTSFLPSTMNFCCHVIVVKAIT